MKKEAKLPGLTKCNVKTCPPTGPINLLDAFVYPIGSNIIRQYLSSNWMLSPVLANGLLDLSFMACIHFTLGSSFSCWSAPCACHMGLSVSFDHTPFQMKLNTKNTILWLSFIFCLAATVFYIVVYEKINYVNIRYLKDAINLIWYRFHLESSQINCFSVF